MDKRQLHLKDIILLALIGIIFDPRFSTNRLWSNG